MQGFATARTGKSRDNPLVLSPLGFVVSGGCADRRLGMRNRSMTIYDRFMEQVLPRVKAIRQGNPLAADT